MVLFGEQKERQKQLVVDSALHTEQLNEIQDDLMKCRKAIHMESRINYIEACLQSLLDTNKNS